MEWYGIQCTVLAQVLGSFVSLPAVAMRPSVGSVPFERRVDDPLPPGWEFSRRNDIFDPAAMWQENETLFSEFTSELDIQVRRLQQRFQGLLAKQHVLMQEHLNCGHGAHDDHQHILSQSVVSDDVEAKGLPSSVQREDGSQTEGPRIYISENDGSPTSGSCKAGSPGSAADSRPSSQRGSSWNSVTRSARHEKRLTEAAYTNVKQFLDEPLQLPPVLTNLASSLKSLHFRVVHRSKENFAQRLVRSISFKCCSALLIVANAIFIGFTVDQDVRAAIRGYQEGNTNELAEQQRTTSAVNLCFTVAVCLEQLLKILALQCAFFVGPHWRWNVFDFVVALSTIVEFVGQNGEMHLSFIRLVRLLRMLRTVRVVRRVKAFRKMRLMLLAMLDSIQALVWAITLLLFVMFLFAVLFLQAATQHFMDAAPGDYNATVFSTFFSSLPMTLLTLWMIVTGGINWWQLEEVWLNVAPGYALLFILYEALMVLALLNIVTGIFVNDSIEVAHNDQDYRALREKERKAQFVRGATRIFTEMDTQKTNKVTRREFEAQLQRNVVRELFHSIGMDVQEAITIFEALDVDGNRELEIDEFVVGCAAIHGQARALDVETLKVQTRRIFMRIVLIEESLRRVVSAITANSEVCDSPAHVARLTPTRD